MTTNYIKTLLIAVIAMGLNFSTSAQCTDWVSPTPTGGWTDFNGAASGGAPCDDGTGCPFIEIDFGTFGIYASEAYVADNFIAGGTYAFSMCNGVGAGSWVPEFTIIAPSGAVDAFGAGDGDACTITWTCSESGTYTMVINEAGNCGVANEIDNGFPALTCDGVICPPPPLMITSITDNGDLTATVVAEGGTPAYTYEWSDGQTTDVAVGLTDGVLYYVTVTDAVDSMVVDSILIGYELICNASVMTTSGAVTACDDEVVDVTTDGTQETPPGGGFGWIFDNDLGGTGGTGGGIILFGIEDPSITSYDNDLNGVLSGQPTPLPPLSGSWTIQGAVYTDPTDPFGTICSLTPETLIVTFSETPMAGAIDNGDGTATAVGQGGTPPYTYEWSDGQTTETAVDLANGDYMVTISGEFGCSAVGSVTVTNVAVDNIASLENVEISPNPTNGQFQINLALNTAEVVSVEVLDVVGRKVQATAASTITNEVYNIDLNNESEGVYIVRLNIGDKVLTRRVVLNK